MSKNNIIGESVTAYMAMMPSLKDGYQVTTTTLTDIAVYTPTLTLQQMKDLIKEAIQELDEEKLKKKLSKKRRIK